MYSVYLDRRELRIPVEHDVGIQPFRRDCGSRTIDPQAGIVEVGFGAMYRPVQWEQ